MITTTVLITILAVLFGGIWICIGLLILNYFEPLLSMIVRKPLPELLINTQDYKNTNQIIKVIGIILILIGVLKIISSIASMFLVQSNMSNFNFKF